MDNIWSQMQSMKVNCDDDDDDVCSEFSSCCCLMLCWLAAITGVADEQADGLLVICTQQCINVKIIANFL